MCRLVGLHANLEKDIHLSIHLYMCIKIYLNASKLFLIHIHFHLPLLKPTFLYGYILKTKKKRLNLITQACNCYLLSFKEN